MPYTHNYSFILLLTTQVRTDSARSIRLTDPQVLKMEASKRETGERVFNFDASFPESVGNDVIYDHYAAPLVEVEISTRIALGMLLYQPTTLLI